MEETPISHADLLWKDLVTEFDAEFILFFLGQLLHDAIDFSVAPIFLEQELNDVYTGDEPSKKVTDKIIRYSLKNGEMKIIILHIEFQGQFDKNFPERMFWYFMYIATKYKTTDITAIAIYTSSTKPKVYDRFTMSNFGTQLTYAFNTYIVNRQKEAALLASENPFSVAVLAALYMIKAGDNDFQRLEFKKRVVEVAIMKNFDRQKSFRLLNFVNHLMTLPPSLQEEFQQFTQSPKIQEKMHPDKKIVMLYGGHAIVEIQEEAREQGEAIGEARAREQTIMAIRRNKKYSAELIADLTSLHVQYVQSVIDKFEKMG
ncbi:MAG: hypothetical protein U5L45_12740 [Saprospiraceae bacterium]|nr:hypothetical protein [Saprospiraceae bacterium]